ncbi:hypothetical protein B0A55_10798 [Friedmanniomyces simplex]|uniref:Uncharacterized protein n=1 Tax=Friedmanniomyces simplex TaxID=329884 RepID=A0A4U0X2Q1_9PEZI|nr:hypothetical protein B0A55_10798 [Friedmanniomyces simplex]
MGNKPSSLNGSPGPHDNASLNSVVRRPVRVLRKSSNNLLKRLDAKSPLPRPLTATSILVAAHGNGDGPLDPFIDPAHSARESIIMLPSASTTTIVDDTTCQPLSASTTIKESRRDSKSPYQAAVEDADEDLVDIPPPVPTHRSSALSPSIPAPSPLPEDSPHKYGLKDHMDTPEPEMDPPVDINAHKARRRSSGLEIFTEAKTLQSASSFLNGLSTHRRRAESQPRTSDNTRPATLTGSSQQLSRPPSRPNSRPTSARPPSAAAAATISNPPASLSAARSPSRSCDAPCALCHMDDGQEHWTCCWCAVRMCRYCRKTLGEGGVGALRERVKVAEGGGGSSASASSSSEQPESWMESLGRGGKGRAFV